MFKRGFIITGLIIGLMGIITAFTIVSDVLADSSREKELVEKWMTENSQEWQRLENIQLDLQRQNNAWRAYLGK